MGWLRCSKEVVSEAWLDGKTAVVTGCNSGVGKETVKELVIRGCRVVMACRDVSKAEDAAKEIRQETSGVAGVGTVVVVILELSSMASIRQCAQQILRTEKNVNILVNNAAVMMCPRILTEDGFENHFAVNHLGHFLFTLLLLPRILASTPARIITVSSSAHADGKIIFDDLNAEKNYNEAFAFAQSKLANILFTTELDKRLKHSGVDGVSVYAVQPGLVYPDLHRHLDGVFCCLLSCMSSCVLGAVIKSSEQAARTTIHCAVDESAAAQSGLYYKDCSVAKASPRARDPVTAQRLWEESVKMTGLQDFNPFIATPCAQSISAQPR